MTPKELAGAHDKLAEQLKTARDLNDNYKGEIVTLRSQLSKDQKRNTELEGQFSDLKTRLLSAERANEFMRGYLARVTEDDQVREDLVQVGDPHGEQALIPKRKSTLHPRPDDFSYPTQSEMMGYSDSARERRRRAKHWITY